MLARMDVIRFERGIRALRQRRDWRQEDLARAAGVSRSAVARVEQGRADRLPVSRLDRIAAAVGARVIVRLEFHAEELDRLIDARHALLVDHVVELLQAYGWICITEATFNVFGERGSIDILAFHPLRNVVLVVEVKSRIPEIGNLLAPLDRKVRLAPVLAKERGWTATSVGRLLVVADESTNRRRIEEHSATFATAFPVRGWDARRWLADPVPTPGWSGLWIPSVGREPVRPAA